MPRQPGALSSRLCYHLRAPTTACETDSGTDGGTRGRHLTRVHGAGDQSSAAPTGPAWTSFAGPLQRCGPQPAGVLEAPFKPITLRDPAVGRIPAVRLGRGRVVVVLLHQTDGNGLCGWLPFMPAAADAGLAVLAIDLCRYGESDCRAVSRGDVHGRRPDRPRGGGRRLRPDRAARRARRGRRSVDGWQRGPDERGHVAGSRCRRGPLGTGGVGRHGRRTPGSRARRAGPRRDGDQ